MSHPIRILLQTTIPTIEDNWYIGRFSLLCSHLASLRDEDGEPLVEVTARDRGPLGKPDPVLSILDRTDSTSCGCSGSIQEMGSIPPTAPPSIDSTSPAEACS
jgi:hypothetical protein